MLGNFKGMHYVGPGYPGHICKWSFFRVGTKSSDCNFFSCAGMERGIGTQAWCFYKKITCLVGFVPP